MCVVLIFVLFLFSLPLILCSTQKSPGHCPAETSYVERNERATFRGSSAEDSCSNNCQADQTALSVCSLRDGKKKGEKNTDSRKQNSLLNFPHSAAMRSDKSESRNIAASSGDFAITTVMHPHIREGQIEEVAKKFTSDLFTGTDSKTSEDRNSEKYRLMCDRLLNHPDKTHDEPTWSQEVTKEACENLANDEEVVLSLINTNTDVTVLECCCSVVPESVDKNIHMENQSSCLGFSGAVTNECPVDYTEECSVSLLACHADLEKQIATCAREDVEPVKHPQSVPPVCSSMCMAESCDSCDSHSPSLLAGVSGICDQSEEMPTVSWCPKPGPTTPWNARPAAHSEPTDITPSLQISHTGLPHLDETHTGEAVQNSHTSADCESGISGIQRDTGGPALNKPVNVCVSPPQSARREGECDVQMSQPNRSGAKCFLIGAGNSEPDLGLRFQPSSRQGPAAPMNPSSLPMVDSSDATMLSQFEVNVNPVNRAKASQNMPGRNLCDVQCEPPSDLQASGLVSLGLTEAKQCVPVTIQIQNETKVHRLDCSSDSDCTMISESEDLMANKSRPDVTDETEPTSPNLGPGPCSQNETSNGNDNVPHNDSESETFSGIVPWSDATASASTTTTTTASIVPNQGLQKRKAKAPKQKKRQSVSGKSQDCWKPWQLGKTFESPTDSPVDKGICSSLVFDC